MQQWHAFLLLVMGAIWGLEFVLLKIATDSDFSELGILTVSLVLLALVFLACLAIKKECFVPAWRHLRYFFISAVFGYIVPMSGILLVADFLSAGLLVFYVEALIPVFTIAITLMFRTERMTSRRFLATALAMLGVVVVMWPEVTGSSSERLWAMLLFLIVPLAYAIDGVYVAARWPEDLSTLQIVTGEAAMGAVILLPLLLLLEGVPAMPTAFGVGEIAILAFVLISLAESLIYFYLIKTEGAVFVSFGVFISLSSGILWGTLLLGEVQRPTLWIAVLLVSAGLYLIVAKPRREAADVDSPAEIASTSI